MFTMIQQKQSKQKFYEKFEAALKVERTVLVLTQGRPDSKRGAPSTSQPDPSQSSRKKGKKWNDGRGSEQGVAFSQGSVRSPATQKVVDLQDHLFHCTLHVRGGISESAG